MILKVLFFRESYLEYNRKKIKNCDKLELTYDTEDIDGQDYEEYGISDIDETYHFSIILKDSDISATIILSHIQLNSLFSTYQKKVLSDFGFSKDDIFEIQLILMNTKV